MIMEFPRDTVERAYRYLASRGDLTRVTVLFLYHKTAIEFGVDRGEFFSGTRLHIGDAPDFARRVGHHEARFPIATGDKITIGCVTFTYDRSRVPKDLDTFVRNLFAPAMLSWFFQLYADPLAKIARTTMPMRTHVGFVETHIRKRLASNLGDVVVAKVSLDHFVVSLSSEDAEGLHALVDVLPGDKVRASASQCCVVLQSIEDAIKALCASTVDVKVGVSRGKDVLRRILGKTKPTFVIDGPSFESAEALMRIAPVQVAVSEVPLHGAEHHQGLYYKALFELDRDRVGLIPYLRCTSRFAHSPEPVLLSQLRAFKPTLHTTRAIHMCHDLWMYGDGKITGSEYESCVMTLLGEGNDFGDLQAISRFFYFFLPVWEHVDVSKAVCHERLCFEVANSRSMAASQLDVLASRVLPAVVRIHARVSNAFTRSLLQRLHEVKRFWQCHL